MKADNKINSRTPDEIKKGLERCEVGAHCNTCLSSYHCQIEEDALAYIQQLERERDAILTSMREFAARVNSGEDVAACEL